VKIFFLFIYVCMHDEMRVFCSDVYSAFLIYGFYSSQGLKMWRGGSER